jgi:hypothetical protein
MQFKKVLLLSITSFIILVSALPVYAASEVNQQNILIVHQGDSTVPGSRLFDDKIIDTLRSHKDSSFSIYSEYLEFVRFDDEATRSKIEDLFRTKYTKIRIDIVIITDDLSLEFISSCRKELFPNASIIASNISSDKDIPKDLGPNVTGIYRNNNYDSSFKVIFKLQPDVKEIAVVLGSSQREKLLEPGLRKVADEYSGRVKIDYLIGKSIEETIYALSRLPEDSAVFYYYLYRDANGKTFTPRDALTILYKNCTAPIYSTSDTFLGYGTIGGNITSYSDMAAETADVALAIANGTNAAHIPFQYTTNKDIFDWNELNKWDIDLGKLPVGSTVVNVKPTLWGQYRGQIIMVAVIIVLEAIAITMLILILVKNHH